MQLSHRIAVPSTLTYKAGKSFLSISCDNEFGRYEGHVVEEDLKTMKLLLYIVR
jgi:hypothetical protein